MTNPAELFPQATPAQLQAIRDQMEAYARPGTPCAGLIGIQHWEGDTTPPEIAVAFQYAYETDPTGTPGLEVTIFAADGSVSGSQDFG